MESQTHDGLLEASPELGSLKSRSITAAKALCRAWMEEGLPSPITREAAARHFTESALLQFPGLGRNKTNAIRAWLREDKKISGIGNWRSRSDDLLFRVGSSCSTTQLAASGERAIIDAGFPLFVRNGALVEQVFDSFLNGTVAPRLKPVNTIRLRDLLSRVATWERYDGRSRQWQKIAAPHEVASRILSRVRRGSSQFHDEVGRK